VQCTQYYRFRTDCKYVRACLVQIATKAGTWNAPIWTEAGQVWANDHPEIPQGEWFCLGGFDYVPLGTVQHV
jgi:hypothetical protein